MKVLIVDDEVIQVEGMNKIIHKLYPEVEVLSAFNGRDAISILDNTNINIVFTDIKMPVMDGIEMLKIWRSKGNNYDKPPYFIIFSGFDEFSYAQLAMRYGALDYLLKPLDIHGISGVLRRIIGNHKTTYEETNNAHSNILIEQVRTYLLEHIDEKLSLEEVALRFSYHPNYFSTLWSSKTNTSFVSYVQKLRMEKACELLENTNLRVCDIAKLVGFNDDKYFCKVFKATYNIPPLAYRRNRRVLDE